MQRRALRVSHLQDLPVHVQNVDGDLHVPGHALPAFLKLSFLQRDVEVVPQLTCGEEACLEDSLLDGVRVKRDSGG